MSSNAGTVYLLHFDSPLGGPTHYARHYIGWAKRLDARLAHHRAGTGAAITARFTQRGIDFQVARTWPNADRTQERRLKRQKHAARYCPLCSGPVVETPEATKE